jgi:hypothetical protein
MAETNARLELSSYSTTIACQAGGGGRALTITDLQARRSRVLLIIQQP